MSQSTPERDAFRREIEQWQMGPLWEIYRSVLTREPKPRVIPYMWRWETVRPRLLRAGDVLLLQGPLGAGKTTLAQGIGALRPLRAQQCRGVHRAIHQHFDELLGRLQPQAGLDDVRIAALVVEARILEQAQATAHAVQCAIGRRGQRRSGIAHGADGLDGQRVKRAFIRCRPDGESHASQTASWAFAKSLCNRWKAAFRSRSFVCVSGPNCPSHSATKAMPSEVFLTKASSSGSALMTPARATG